jgi:phosphoglycolate phosphatase-like HAD superfamily hydrolase
LDAIPQARLERVLLLSCYSGQVKVAAVCVFDLDHTLVNSPLDLSQVAREMEAFARRSGLLLPERELPWYGAEVLELIRGQAPQLERELMAVPVAFERNAMQEATLEPSVRELLVQLRMRGYATAVWTNNDSVVTEFVIAKFKLQPWIDLVVTRDQVRRLKPDGDGLELVKSRWPDLPSVVVGDSWVDAAPALEGGVPFIGYKTNESELTRRRLPIFANVISMAQLLAIVGRLFGESISRSQSTP